jgi:hypothetical protein
MIRLGWNGDRQTKLEQVPRKLLLEGFDVPTYRGKRFMEVNCAESQFRNISILDAYSPVGQDTQAICVLNTPGELLFQSLHLQASSNCLMLGGDRPWIPGNHIKGVIIEDCLLDKPLEWKVANYPKVKNGFEIKDGWDVIFRNNIIRNCWQSAQVGYGIVLTPSRGSLQNISIDDCTVENCAGIFNITGTDVSGMFPERTQVRVNNGIFKTNKPEMGGTGWFALITRGVEYFECYGSQIDCDAQVIVCESTIPIDRIVMKGNTFPLNKYGISINGHHAQLETPFQNNIVKELIIEGNTIEGATSKFKQNFPNNTYL